MSGMFNGIRTFFHTPIAVKAKVALAGALTVPLVAGAAMAGPQVGSCISTALHQEHVFEGTLPAYKTLDPSVKLQALRAGEGKTLALLPIQDKSGVMHEPVSIRVRGSLADLEKSLTAEGWTKAESGTVGADIRTYLSLLNGITGRHIPWKESNSPMTVMAVKSKTMVAGYEKNNDFHLGRDHLRIFDLGVNAQGLQEWGMATTRDVAVVVRLKPFGSSHRIDPNIDGERDDVIHDIVKSGHGKIIDAAKGVAAPDYAPLVERQFKSDGLEYELAVD